VVAVALGPGRQRGDIAASARLGHRERRDLALDDARGHEPPRLLGRAEPDDRRQRDPVATQPDDGPDRAPREHQLVGRDQDVAEVAALPAHRLGVPDAGHPGRGGGPVQLDRELLVLLPAGSVRRDVRLREPPRARPDRGVLFGLEQIGHGATQHTDK
jgi:hypothetical protein